ncbi:unnamed protein product [Fraxinus pennsylvanica]|uniref:Uncharacterized protein n=1 Tax=Fraxinus pennsylvanica TaxID=56036 RepID=A0AAD2E9K9_9LAMI|nr:unnamed protein product [Fraxinus pennsylvanica]
MADFEKSDLVFLLFVFAPPFGKHKTTTTINHHQSLLQKKRDDFPAAVGNGTSIAGYHQKDLMTSVNTGDLTQIQVEIELTGTQFGIKPLGYPMPKTSNL